MRADAALVFVLVFAILAVALFVVTLGLAIVDFTLGERITDLSGRVACLERPQGESSIAGRFVGRGKHRHFVVTQPATRTGCAK